MSVSKAWGKGPGIVGAIFLGALILLGQASAAQARHRHGHHHRQRHTVRGIDVSHYQGAIDWRAVSRDNVAFAYIKATEGVSGRDARFARNWRGARQAGLRVGAYHYFIFCRSPRAQARNFLAVTPRMSSALPPAVDIESTRGCRGRLAGAEMRRDLETYLAIVEARQGRRAVLYVTPRFFDAYGRWLPQRRMWRRSIQSEPNRSWVFWQYRSRGRVAGVPTHVDLNIVRTGRHADTL